MLSAAVEAAGIAEYLDAVLSVDAVRVYKPRPEVYALVTDALALERSDVGFVSSNRWDVMGAASFGFQAYWVNRLAVPDEYPDFAPQQRISDLAALPAA
jgi:2-haloacid dehalogenase